MDSFLRTRLPALLFALAFATVSLPLGDLVHPQVAWAQAGARDLQKALKKATTQYDNLEIEESKTTLRKAIAQAEKKEWGGLALGKVYVMLGIVLQAESAAESDVEELFVKAIEESPEATIPDVYKTPALEKIYDSAKRKAKPKTGDPVDPDNGSGTDSFTHKGLEIADAGKPLRFEVKVPTNMPIFRVVVYYRRLNETNYNEFELKANSNGFAAELPGAEVRTSQLFYYIVGFDRGGNQLAAVKSDKEPFEVLVRGSSSVELPKGSDDDGDGIRNELDKCPDKPEDPDGVEDEDGCPEDDEGASEGGGYVFLGGGTDVGFLAGGQPTANPSRADTLTPGLAPAFGHVLLDAGWRITANAYLGLYWRFQFSPAQDFSAIPAESLESNGFFDSRQECLGLGLPGDCLLGIKYRWFFAPGDRARFYSSVGSGIGRIRNWLRLKQTPGSGPSDPCSGKEIFQDSNGTEFCFIRDTVRTGWFHFGVGVGAAFPVTSFMDLVADSYMMVLIPETSINLDITAGVNFRF